MLFFYAPIDTIYINIINIKNHFVRRISFIIENMGNVQR